MDTEQNTRQVRLTCGDSTFLISTQPLRACTLFDIFFRSFPVNAEENVPEFSVPHEHSAVLPSFLGWCEHIAKTGLAVR